MTGLDGGDRPAVDREAAAAQLAALQADRAALAERVRQPWWYDAALGLLLFGFLASYAFDSLWVTFPALVLFLVALRALVAAYQRITGGPEKLDTGKGAFSADSRSGAMADDGPPQ